MIHPRRLNDGDVVFWNGYPGVIKVTGSHRTFQAVSPDGKVWKEEALGPSDKTQLDLVCTAKDAAKRYASTLKVIYDE
jgi:hypothetical protein